MQLLQAAAEHLLPLYGLTVHLRVQKKCIFPFYHEGRIAGWLKSILYRQSKEQGDIWFECHESGRTMLYPDERYSLTIFFNNCDHTLLYNTLVLLRKSFDNSPLQSFQSNFQFENFTDYFGGVKSVIVSLKDHYSTALTPYTADDLREETSFFATASHCAVSIYKPARIMLPSSVDTTANVRSGKQGAAFIRNSGLLHKGLFLRRVQDTFFSILKPRCSVDMTLHDAALRGIEDDIFHVECGYRGTEGIFKRMGGVLGTIRYDFTGGLSAEEKELLSLLVLGQYFGVGQRRLFGLGRYVIVTYDGVMQKRVIPPSVTLLQRVASKALLSDAIKKDTLGHCNEKDWEKGAHSLEEEKLWDVDTFQRKLIGGTYAPEKPRTFEVTKEARDASTEKRRKIEAPCYTDMVVQKAFGALLTREFRSLFSESSFGFRPSVSRFDAAERVMGCIKEGYTCFLESDISNFYLSIDRRRLLERMRVVYGHDTGIDLLRRILETSSEAGIPQGYPISPVLSNFYLSDFDHDLHNKGFRFVRYADDFIVAVRSKDEALEALYVVQKLLKDVALDLKLEKTKVSNLDQETIRFLGFEFSKSSYCDVSQDKYSYREEGVSKNGKSFLYITGHRRALRSKRDTLNVYTNKQEVLKLSYSQLEGILVFGRHDISSACTSELLKRKIPLYFASESGAYRGVLTTKELTHNGYSHYLKQEQLFTDRSIREVLSKKIVYAKLLMQRETLRQRMRDMKSNEESAQQNGRIARALRELRRHEGRYPEGVVQAETLDRLRGIEGAAAREYFQVLRYFFPRAFGFTKRVRRPPTDPVNVLLSIGYTSLYSLCYTMLLSENILPWVGFYHEASGRHACLASDLMDPFRYIADRAALNVLNRKQITWSSFKWSDVVKEGGWDGSVDAQKGTRRIHLNHQGYRTYLSELMSILGKKSLRSEAGESISPQEALRDSVKSIKQVIQTGDPGRFRTAQLYVPKK
jgi:CRISPR-associated endonuclease Cas1